RLLLVPWIAGEGQSDQRLLRRFRIVATEPDRCCDSRQEGQQRGGPDQGSALNCLGYGNCGQAACIHVALQTLQISPQFGSMLIAYLSVFFQRLSDNSL